MSVMVWHRGETRSFGVRNDGDYFDAQMRIGTPPSCTIISATIQTVDIGGRAVPVFAFSLDDGQLGALAIGPYSVSIWMRNSAGWLCRDTTHTLQIMEVC